MKKIVYFVLVFTSIILFSCVKEISIPQQPYTSKPSIQCLITPGKIPKLYLNKTLPFLDPAGTSKSMFIANANITLTGNG